MSIELRTKERIYLSGLILLFLGHLQLIFLLSCKRHELLAQVSLAGAYFSMVNASFLIHTLGRLLTQRKQQPKKPHSST